MEKIRKGVYRHFKGKMYEVIGVAKHSETLQDLVVYRALYDSSEFGSMALWVRPLDNFLEMVNIDGKEVARFIYVKESAE